MPWYCMKYWQKNNVQSINPSEWCYVNLFQICFRFGINTMLSDLVRSTNWIFNNIITPLEYILPSEMVQDIINNPPIPYLIPVSMDINPILPHVFHGRRLKIPILLFDVNNCNWCGRVNPCHKEPVTGNAYKHDPIQRFRISNKRFQYWKFTCDTICKGGWFYSI